MPRCNVTGSMVHGTRTGQGMGRCDRQGCGTGGMMGGGRRFLRMGQARTWNLAAINSWAVQSTRIDASSQQLTRLEQQVQWVTQNVQALAPKLNDPRQPAPSRHEGSAYPLADARKE